MNKKMVMITYKNNTTAWKDKQSKNQAEQRNKQKKLWNGEKKKILLFSFVFSFTYKKPEQTNQIGR